MFFISLLIVTQHVSGNHVPIIRSWRMRDVIASCWYVPWLQESGQVRLVGSASYGSKIRNKNMEMSVHVCLYEFWDKNWNKKFFFLSACRIAMSWIKRMNGAVVQYKCIIDTAARWQLIVIVTLLSIYSNDVRFMVLLQVGISYRTQNCLSPPENGTFHIWGWPSVT
jgi:hypothetical protein